MPICKQQHGDRTGMGIIAHVGGCFLHMLYSRRRQADAASGCAGATAFQGKGSEWAVQGHSEGSVRPPAGLLLCPPQAHHEGHAHGQPCKLFQHIKMVWLSWTIPVLLFNPKLESLPAPSLPPFLTLVPYTPAGLVTAA